MLVNLIPRLQNETSHKKRSVAEQLAIELFYFAGYKKQESAVFTFYMHWNALKK